MNAIGFLADNDNDNDALELTDYVGNERETPFATYRGKKVWLFADSGAAYDATQCWDEISNGDLLLIPSEKIVGIAYTYPFVVTAFYGSLHRAEDMQTVVKYSDATTADIAVDLAMKCGFPLMF